MGDGPLFILAGNGPYQNRGCEAIVRGTTKILRQFFDEPRFVCINNHNSKEQLEEQRKNETDTNILHLSSYILDKRKAMTTAFSPRTIKYLFRSICDQQLLSHSIYEEVLPYLPEAKAVLSVGGDNYSLDYGKPWLFTMLDDLILEKKKPLVIWGASIGPFRKLPEYEQYMSRHLRDVTAIFARESITMEYLKDIDVTDNVHSTADPSFAMDPIKPKSPTDFHIDKEAIGVNLSPLMAKYMPCNEPSSWMKSSASIVERVAQCTELPIYLIPHVTTPTSDDYTFMQQVLRHVKKKKNITIVPPTYNAAELKWIIGQMTLFAGARTHSTIAALSSGVPTLSFAYSAKAIGINRDIFGHESYLLKPDGVTADGVVQKIGAMIRDIDEIREVLHKRNAFCHEAALNAGAILQDLLE